YQIARGHEEFLVSQADRLAGFNGLVSGFESSDANDGADHEIHFWMSGHLHRASRAVNHLDVVAQPRFLEPVLQMLSSLGQRHRHDLRAPPACLLEGEFHVVASGHAHYRKALGEALNNAERAPADGAGRAEDGDSFHCEFGKLVYNHHPAEVLAKDC